MTGNLGTSFCLPKKVEDFVSHKKNNNKNTTKKETEGWLVEGIHAWNLRRKTEIVESCHLELFCGTFRRKEMHAPSSHILTSFVVLYKHLSGFLYVQKSAVIR